jgi:predicted dithiol-disulfide oxidoreductase (DUF899 family)
MTTTTTIPHPPIVSRDQWLAERKKLLAHEKELTKHYDRVNAENSFWSWDTASLKAVPTLLLL